jgi:hypothetical protein
MNLNGKHPPSNDKWPVVARPVEATGLPGKRKAMRAIFGRNPLSRLPLPLFPHRLIPLRYPEQAVR